jgi:hypothetical protein
MTLSTDIMNLPAKLDPKHDGWDRTFFELGHRDARHAAAEIAGAREGELVGVLQSIINAWEADEIGQIDGSFIEAAREAIK